MRKLMIAALVCALACVMAACSSNTPKAAAAKYTEAVIKGDYKSALELVYFKGTPDEAAKRREQYVSLCEEKAKNGIKDKDKLTSYKITDEQIDEENGTAVVTAELTYADGHSKTDNMKLRKAEDGQWMIDSNK